MLLRHRRRQAEVHHRHPEGKCCVCAVAEKQFMCCSCMPAFISISHKPSAGTVRSCAARICCSALCLLLSPACVNRVQWACLLCGPNIQVCPLPHITHRGFQQRPPAANNSSRPRQVRGCDDGVGVCLWLCVCYLESDTTTIFRESHEQGASN